MHMECALFLVTCLVQCKSEDWVSDIPCAWVVEPSPIAETGFPVEGRCYTGGRRLHTSFVRFRLAYMYI